MLFEMKAETVVAAVLVRDLVAQYRATSLSFCVDQDACSAARTKSWGDYFGGVWG